MLTHVRMVGCTLKRNIEGDLEPMLFCCGNKPLEIFHGSKFGMNGFMAALY